VARALASLATITRFGERVDRHASTAADHARRPVDAILLDDLDDRDRIGKSRMIGAGAGGQEPQPEADVRGITSAMIDTRTRTLLALAAIAAIAAPGCGGGQKEAAGAGPEAGGKAREPAPADEPAPARKLTEDQTVTSASGATFTASAGWTVQQGRDRITLTTPEGDLSVVLVEVPAAAAKNREAAIAKAWAQVRPGFDLKVAQSQDVTAREGWDEIGQTVYVTPAAERRIVVAFGRRKGATWYVGLLDGRQEGLSRRGAQLQTAVESFKPPGLEKESFAGKTAHPLDDRRLAELETFAEAALTTAKVPGAAIAIVQGDKIVYEKGFGVRKLGKPGKVSPRTLFMIGSVTKQLTTLLMARLVDQKKFGWDTPVTEVLPSFALGDAATTAAATMRHMVCACTGMPRQDLEFIFEYGKVTPEDRLASMKTMKPTTALGETFQYSNLMVSAGGFAAGHARSPKLKLGPAYDAAMKELVFGPLGMKSTTFDFGKAARSDHAAPHPFDLRGEPVAVPIAAEEWTIPVRPAGAAWSNVRDLSRVILLELGKGTIGGKEIVSEVNMLARRDQQVKITSELGYGLGLVVGTAHGVQVLRHGGGTAGFRAELLILPEHGVGLAILTNGVGGGAFNQAVERRMMEILFDGEPEAQDDLAEAMKLQQKTIDEEWKLVQADPDPAWVNELAGAWTADGLGRIELRREKGKAVFDAGEWSVTFGKKTDRDGTVKLVTTGAPLAGIELIPRDKNGRKVLVLEDGQHSYVFERAAK
jgi:CubicO group peptidase (beta-lactamase class C family)